MAVNDQQHHVLEIDVEVDASARIRRPSIKRMMQLNKFVKLEAFLDRHHLICCALGLLFWFPCILLNLVNVLLGVLTIPIKIVYQRVIGRERRIKYVQALHAKSLRFLTSNMCINESQVKSAHTKSVSIVTWNLWAYFGRFWLRKSIILDELAFCDADIFCFQEVTTSYVYACCDMVKSIGQYLSKTNGAIIQGFAFSFGASSICDYVYPVLADVFLFFTDLCSHLMNTIFLLPIWRSTFYEYYLASTFWSVFISAVTGYANGTSNAILFRRCQIESKSIKMVGQSNLLCALYVDAANQIKCWVFNIHLFMGPTFDPNQQIPALLKMMDDCVQQEPCDFIVFCGDFNAKPDSVPIQLIKQHGFQSCMESHHGADLITYPTHSFTFEDTQKEEARAIDYIFYKQVNPKVKLHVADCKLIGTHSFVKVQHCGEDRKVFASDHLGIFAKLSYTFTHDQDEQAPH